MLPPILAHIPDSLPLRLPINVRNGISHRGRAKGSHAWKSEDQQHQRNSNQVAAQLKVVFVMQKGATTKPAPASSKLDQDPKGKDPKLREACKRNSA